MAAESKNYTFTLPIGTVEKLRQFVQDEHISSLNAGVREAIEEYTVKLARGQFRREMEKAGKDEAFLADVRDTMQAFAGADAETAGRTGE